MYIMIYIDISHPVPPILMGLKVNKSTLDEKNVTIEEVANLLGLTEKYVIGYDVNLSEVKEPHYHIHFSYYGTLVSIQKFKQRKLKDYGKSTKLYQAKDKKESNPYTWYGYAVKENLIFMSADLNKTALDIESHTQYEFKKAKLKYGKKLQDKKDKKLSTEEKVFAELEEVTKHKTYFVTLMSKMCEIYLKKHKQMLSIQRLEYLTYKYLLLTERLTYEQYVSFKFDNIKENFCI